jgi:hypothetical protein
MDMSVVFNGLTLITSDIRLYLAGVLVSSAADPTSFNNFSQVKPFFQMQGEGIFCFPLDFLANANGTNLVNGQNVTIQVILLDFSFCAHSNSRFMLDCVRRRGRNVVSGRFLE